jgi:soluble lytic murein transglycosylase-like protein
MSAPRTGAPAPRAAARRRRRRPFAAVVALLVIVALVGSAFIGGWMALTGTTQGQRIIGAPIVVPDDLRPIIRKAAKRCDAIPLEVFAAQIAAESSWDPRAVSPAGAQGIAQFMPEVWKQYGIDANKDGVADVWDPVDAIHSAAELNCLNRRLVRDASGDRLLNTLAAYNAGFGSVLKHDGVPPFPETEAYIERIMRVAQTIVISDPPRA